MESKVVIFNGETFIRNPKSRYYFKHTTRNEERKKAKQLHRAVWEYYHGEIPAKHHVHHIDGNIDNNDIANLGCLPRTEHLRLHSKILQGNPEYVAKQMASIAKAGEASKAWHASEQGIAWHREHAAESIGKVRRNLIEKRCGHCGKTIMALPWQEYCCQSCGEKARRRRIGLKFEPHERACDYCGSKYLAKNTISKYCSSLCKRRHHAQRGCLQPND